MLRAISRRCECEDLRISLTPSKMRLISPLQIIALRTAMMMHPNLKRIFLNSTDLSSEGAIALAEFLPEAKSLIHLDLTGNYEIDIAGVLALSVSLKMNETIRCLDLHVPPNDPDFASLSQDILQT